MNGYYGYYHFNKISQTKMVIMVITYYYELPIQPSSKVVLEGKVPPKQKWFPFSGPWKITPHVHGNPEVPKCLVDGM